MQPVNILSKEILHEITVQDIAIALAIFFLMMILKNFLSKAILQSLRFLAGKTKTNIDNRLIDTLESPFRFLFIVLGFYFAQNYIDLKAHYTIPSKITSTLAIFTAFWIVFNIITEFNAVVTLFSSKLGKLLNRDIENFIVKSCKVFIFILGFLVILQSWGINITTFLASLGLGGLAFALAAKDTTANLFGSLVIFADRPFQTGDIIELNGIEGTVEDIGIRSTRIRTFPRSLVAIPNAVVANASIINWSKRTSRRCKLYIGLTYDTNSTQMQNIVNQIKQTIQSRDDVCDESLAIYFEEFGDSSLNILCNYHTKATDWQGFLKVKQEVNFSIMKIVEENGSSFAFPTRTLHVDSLPKEISWNNDSSNHSSHTHHEI